MLGPMNWRPKDWRWPPRLANGFGWLRRTLPHALAAARKALRNIDRRTFRRILAGLLRALNVCTAWLKRNYVWLLIVTVSTFFSIFWAQFIWQLPGLIRSALGLLSTELRAPAPNNHDAIRSLAYAIGALLAALALLAAAPFQLIKVWVNERQTNTAEQGLITDRITRAVEQLGKEKTVKRREREIKYRLPDAQRRSKLHRLTEIEGEEIKLPDGAKIRETGDWVAHERTEPNLEVRLGAIYALERIAQDSERDYSVILEILCAYIRSNAPSSGAQKIEIDKNIHPALATKEIKQEVSKIVPPKIDIQAAMETIGRRNVLFDKPTRKRLDLRFCNLQSINLQGLNFEGAMISGSKLDGATFIRCNLDNISGTPKEYSQSFNSDGDVSISHIDPTSMIRTHIIDCSMERVSLSGCQFDGSLIRNTDMNTSYLIGCSFRWVRFEHSGFSKSTIGCADLRFASGLNETDLMNVLGDRGTVHSIKMLTPQHWTKYAPLFADYDSWRAWLDAGAPTEKTSTEQT